jgi:excinuclease UvrABC nuclease subunit
MIPWVAGNETKVPELPGVYELLVKQEDGKYLRRYIGQGDSLRERFQRHLSPLEPNACIRERLAKYVCAFDYAVVSDRDDRLDAEKALYERYRSQAHCNHVPPSGSGRPYDVEIVEE